MLTNRNYFFLKNILLSFHIIYTLVHFLTMSFANKLDNFYALFLITSFIIIQTTKFQKLRIIKIIKINLFFIFFIIFFFEFLLLSGIIKNKKIIPIQIGKIVGGWWSGVREDGLRSDIVVENINISPFFKFKSNKNILTVHDRGDDFEYSWITDNYGFKNYNLTDLNYQFSYIALGDSFTEGMGVTIDDTWTNILGNIANEKIYNAGVQGYSPTQFSGTLNLLKDKISFEGVIIGHLPKIYIREKNFINFPIKATGGIESIRENSLKNIEQLAMPQLFKALRSEYKGYKKIKILDEKYLELYLSEIPSSENIDKKDELENNLYWKNLIKSYKEIINYCIINNKKILLVAFPYRYEVYFPVDILNLNSVLETQYYIELNLLKKELSMYNIEFIDTFPALTSYMKNLKNKKELPYFLYDGHFSKYGNKIIAETILPFLN